MAQAGFSLEGLMAAQGKLEEKRLAEEKLRRDVTEQQQAAALKKAGSAVDVMKLTREVQKQSHQTSDANLEAQSYLTENASELARKEEEAIALTDSGKLSDRLTLAFKQLQDPTYTRAGNSARQQKLAQTSTTLNHFEAQKQQAYQRQMEAMAADFEIATKETDLNLLPQELRLEMATMLREQSNSAVEAMTKAVETRANLLNNDAVLQDKTIMNLTDEQVSEAQQAARNNPDGIASVAGAELSLGRLDTAVIAREDRQYNVQTRELAIASNNAEQQKSAEARIARAFTVPEIDGILANNGKLILPDGTPILFELDMLKKLRDSSSEAQSRVSLERANTAGIGGISSIITEHNTFAQALPPTVAGSALGNALASYQFTTHSAVRQAELNEPGTDGYYEATRLANDALMVTRERLEAEIEKQAKLEGKGSEFRYKIAHARLSGQVAPSDAVEAEVTNRLMSFKSVSDIVTAEQAVALQTDFRDIYADLQTDAMAGGTGFSIEKPLLRQEAAARAYTKYLGRIAEGPQGQAIQAQVHDTTHPLYAKISPGKFMGLEEKANTTGAMNLMRQMGLEPNLDDWAILESGGTVDGKTVKDLAPELRLLQSSALFESLSEEFDVKTAVAVADWWAESTGDDFIARQAQGATERAIKGPPADYITNSLAIPKMVEGLQVWASATQQGINDFQHDQLARKTADFRAFGNHPENYQVALMTRDDSLSDLDRQEAYAGLIEPLLAEAKQRSLPYREANLFIEESLRNMMPADPRLKALHKKVSRNRMDALESMDQVLELQTTRIYDTSTKKVNPNRRMTGDKIGTPGPAWYTSLKSREGAK